MDRAMMFLDNFTYYPQSKAIAVLLCGEERFEERGKRSGRNPVAIICRDDSHTRRIHRGQT